ncbi:MAG: hypothetical protein V1777_04680 [Candidatus Micrarchaeota archaeon]
MGKNRGQSANRPAFSNGFREQMEHRGAQFSPSARFADKASPDERQPHAGKPNQLRRIEQLRRMGNQARTNGETYEQLAHKIFPDYIRPHPPMPGVDLMSWDGTNRIEVKGTQNMENMGTFDNIKTLNRELMNEAATQFLLITPTHAYLCNTNALRNYVKQNHAQLNPRRIKGDERKRITITILGLLNAKILITPHGDVQGWRIYPNRKRVIERVANHIVFPEPKKSTRPQPAKLSKRTREYEEDPRFQTATRESMGRPAVSRTRGNRKRKR